MSNPTLQELTEQQNAQRALPNAVIVSSIVELGMSVIRTISDTDVGESIKNDGLTKPVLANMVANRVKQKLAI